MDIILKQDVYNLGQKDEIVKVKSGYARNYLIPKGLAIVANDPNKKILSETLKQRAFKEEKLKKEAQKVAESLNGISIKIGAKTASTGKIFGSVNTMQIADAIKSQHNIDIDRKKIMVNIDHIKEVGNYKAKINLHKEVSVDIEFEVYSE